MDRFNYQDLKNEEEFLRLPELDSPSIVRYVDFAEDDNFGYLVLQLCEYTLEEYIQDHLPDDTAERTLVLKKLVKEVLCSLQVLHDQKTKVLHRDIKPQNVLIDIKGKARLADFGISRRLKQGETTIRTSIAGTRCWKAKENIHEKVNTGYKRSSDIQVAGMLVYYILSGGHHPFGEDVDCEYNILRGRYSLEHLDDDVAKDLVEWMIKENPNERPTVEQTLAHPFFWADDRRVRYLKILGNEKEAENCRNADEELLNAFSKHTEGKSFSEWKNKLPSELVQKLDGKKKPYPENTLGLLRFIRNLHEHYRSAPSSDQTSQGNKIPSPPSGPTLSQLWFPELMQLLSGALCLIPLRKDHQEVGSQESERQDKEVTAGTSVEESISSVQLLTLENPNISRRWHQTSHRWRPKLEKLANIDASRTHRLPGLTLVIDSEFLIANGSDGTQVFLGLRDDGTEVAVKRMIRFNYQVLRNEEEFLRLPELDSPSIVRYVDFAEDDNFGYLVLQLCEYTLEEYIQDHLPDDTAERTLVLKKLVKEVLCSLEVLHSQQSRVVHRDIKPQNVLIDIKGKARLADFGISRRFKQTETTLRTRIAGTRCWKAKETIKEKVNTNYKRSSDIQVAGMLVYYILSGGHHPFGEDVDCEYNISRGRYSLQHLDDDVAKDLVEWMINENPNERPTVEQTLAHPFFWTDDRRVWYLKILGSEKEAENCRNADEELLNVISKHTEGKSYSEWKTKFPSELVQKLDGKKKVYPENTLGLLRFIRNLHEHYKPDAVKINLMALFPDLFGTVYILAKERGWNSRESVIMDINSAS
ncbi:putative serine threonine- kinase irlB [Labeo rohita]|uniref:Putative serine threonine-kinase irlB n=1 Tax=Labeo rohita TaxID=84645 RepID=A0A498MM85_LABRO|nr:putative serine threonine- kinase irlB [Labeo rohita]